MSRDKTKYFRNKKYSDEQIKLIQENLNNKPVLRELLKEFEIEKYKNVGVECINNCKTFPCENCKKEYLSNRYKGENNPFYGKKHTQETRDKIKDSWENPSEVKQKYIEFLASDENKKQLSEKFSGENNPNYGRNTGFKSMWIEKYGLESGTTKHEQWIETQRTNSSGSNNPMFGKPSPQGSGNGWSGWYKDWFFRSINELSYMINVIEKNNLSWENGELKKYKIPYVDYKGTQRNYFPDFIIGNKIVEIKPTRLHEAPNIKTKTEAAIKFAEERGMTYEIVEIDKISTTEIIELYKTKQIKFTEKYEQKFIEKYSHLF